VAESGVKQGTQAVEARWLHKERDEWLGFTRLPLILLLRGERVNSSQVINGPMRRSSVLPP